MKRLQWSSDAERTFKELLEHPHDKETTAFARAACEEKARIRIEATDPFVRWVGVEDVRAYYAAIMPNAG